MGPREIADELYDVCCGVVEREGLALIDVEMALGRRTVLRFVIDGDGGATIDDCVRVDRALGDHLEEWGRAPARYVLEVTSPGLDRRLRRREEYDHFRGRAVKIHADVNGEGVRELAGVLGGLEGDEVLLDREGERLRIPVDKIAKARLWFEGPGGAGSGRKR
ncbi:MAG: ribosome maturation factor [Candidatus Eisenbacteria bacterium]